MCILNYTLKSIWVGDALLPLMIRCVVWEQIYWYNSLIVFGISSPMPSSCISIGLFCWHGNIGWLTWRSLANLENLPQNSCKRSQNSYWKLITINFTSFVVKLLVSIFMVNCCPNWLILFFHVVYWILMKLIHKQLRSPGPSILFVIVGSGMYILVIRYLISLIMLLY